MIFTRLVGPAVFLQIFLFSTPAIAPAKAQTVTETVQSYFGSQTNPFKDRSKWAQLPKEVVDWYSSQRITDATKKRLSLPYSDCCGNGDVFKTRFRMIEDGSKYGAETYEYEKNGKWLLIPPDVVQHKRTPDGQPRLFLRSGGSGEPVCFIIDEEGI